MNFRIPAILYLFFIPALSMAQIDTNTVVYSWKLDPTFSNRQRVAVDTALDNFEIRDPLLKKYTSFSTLGNLSQPAESNIFTERDEGPEFILINPFFPYMQRFDQINYINTRKPFTQISYNRGGSSQNKEEWLDAFHTQNLSKILNIGLHYRTINSMGQYSFQKVRNNSFGLFSSRNGKMWSYHASINYNKIIADENGGVAGDSVITDTTYQFTKDIPTLFKGVDNPPTHEPDVYSIVRDLNIFTSQELNIRKKKNSADSTVTIRNIKLFYPKIVYIFQLDRASRVFIDKNNLVGYDAGLYPEIHFSTGSTHDSLTYLDVTNAFRLQFQGKKSNHYFVDYNYELQQYSMVAPAQNPGDTLSQHWFISERVSIPGLSVHNRLYNSFLTSGFNKVFVNHVELNAYGKLYLAGYRAGDIYLSGNLRLFTGKAGKQNSLLFSASNEVRTPSFIYTHYVSNNYIWTRNFKPVTTNRLSIDLSVSSKKFDIQADYRLIYNFIYFDKEAFPTQHNYGLSVLTVSALKQFDFWKITSLNKVVYQKTDDQEILGLPEFSVVSSTYLTHLINFRATGGKLLTMLGFDLWYNTKYYADAYQPALTTFYRQSEKKMGGHPYIDPFLNVQLKRFRVYLKFEHVNSSIGNKDYFSVLHYPRNERNFKFGLSWTFYD
jgi:hypothetical protein